MAYTRSAPVCGDFGNRNRLGHPCNKWPTPGTQACVFHAGKQTAKHKADGALRKAVDDWGISRNEYIDPGDTLLRLIAQASRRVQRYADTISHLIQQQAAGTDEPDDEDEHDAAALEARRDAFFTAELAVLLAPEYAVTKDGDRVYIGKQLSALTKLESEERDRLANWCRVAIAAGLEERRVKAAEQQGMQLAAVVRALAEQLDLSPEQMQLLPEKLRVAVDTVYGRTRAIEGSVV